ncbi:hypothetical protein AB0K93_23945 [Streptomyces sp. NPDC052676]|uniref:hypothetical protein n=1 Tax=Streptomyces sp. NPDC052676 TaxID=3154953 RepID=UPI0034266712
MPTSATTENPQPEKCAESGADSETAQKELNQLEPQVAEPADEGGRKGATGRHGLLIAAALLLACGGLVGYGILDTAEDTPELRAVPTAEVTYEVTGKGTAEVTFLAHSETGKAVIEKNATLPWKKTVQVPLGKTPTVAILLDETGGQVACDLAIGGRHVQRATAMGAFGRATCTGPVLRSRSR